ncbi:MAG: hypothetical protein [Olavius algarvensis Gamma 1 endosymbiont]|nr:MAG: hypothetical protein [Olavius algarvensis Gamma 1 endosymbiont]
MKQPTRSLQKFPLPYFFYEFQRGIKHKDTRHSPWHLGAFHMLDILFSYDSFVEESRVVR